jgi:hypothetical protein
MPRIRVIALAEDRCSYLAPAYCSSVWALFVFSNPKLLAADPLLPPRDRWLWHAGALYSVTDATADFAGYAGGTVHVLGLERARANVAEVGVPLVLFPAGVALDPAAAFAVETPVSPGAPRFGLAYATAPEPAAFALGTMPVVLLVALARWRSAARR